MVDLPAPFGPSRPKTVPAGHARSEPVERADVAGIGLDEASASIASTFVLLPDVGERACRDPLKRYKPSRFSGQFSVPDTGTEV